MNHKPQAMPSCMAFIFATFLLAGTAAAVENLQYTYIEVGYETGEVDAGAIDIDFDSFGAAGSFALTDNLAITAAASKGEIETAPYAINGRDTDIDLIEIGLVPHYEIGDNIDLIIPVAIIRSEIQSGALLDDDDTGFSIGVGIRALTTEQIELGVGLQYVDIFDDDDTGLFGSARFHATDNVSFALGATYSDDSQSLVFTGRYAF